MGSVSRKYLNVPPTIKKKNAKNYEEETLCLDWSVPVNHVDHQKHPPMRAA